jgi:hypothetical protein
MLCFIEPLFHDLIRCARSQLISRENMPLNKLAYAGFHNAAYCQTLEPWVGLPRTIGSIASKSA